MAEDTGEIGREAAEAAGFANIKTLGEATAFYTAQAMANSNVQQQQGWALSNAITGKIAEMVINTSPSEGGADVSALAQLAKLVQGTPPATNLPTQGQ